MLLSSWFLISFSPLSAQQATHTLKATPKTVAWGYYDAKAAPVLRVSSGDTEEIQTSTASATAQDEKHPLIFVKHLSFPRIGTDPSQRYSAAACNNRHYDRS